MLNDERHISGVVLDLLSLIERERERKNEKEGERRQLQLKIIYFKAHYPSSFFSFFFKTMTCQTVRHHR